MKFFSSAFVALLSAPLLIAAQSSCSKPNCFNIPNGGLTPSAGQPLQLSWNPSPDWSGTVSLVLRSGASSDLNAGEIIASNIPNSGSYTWNVPSSAVRASDYTIEIVDAADPSNTNYTPYFVLESSNLGTPGLSSVSIGAPTSSLALSTATGTGSSGTMTVTSTGTNSSGSPTTTRTETTTGTSTGDMTSSSGDSSSSNTAESSVGIQTTSESTGGAARATAMAGMLGAVALGAMAL